jgi:DeoR/GlpR family transcriptional regulator of sugar metabolism
MKESNKVQESDMAEWLRFFAEMFYKTNNFAQTCKKVSYFCLSSAAMTLSHTGFCIILHVLDTTRQPMLQQERYRFIFDQLSQHKKVHTDELARLLKISVDTVRRDLIQLEEEGKLVRVHGGAIGVDFNTPFQPKEIYAQKEKMAIARKALGLIEDGMTLLAGGGTVMLELARLLPENLKGMLFTVSPLVALEAAQRSSIDVILIAGRLSRNSYICTGSSVVGQITEIKADLCLMGANGFSIKNGVTDSDWEVMQVKKAMIKNSERIALLSLSEKKDSTQKFSVCPLHSIHYLVTERQPADAFFADYYGHCKVL